MALHLEGSRGCSCLQLAGASPGQRVALGPCRLTACTQVSRCTRCSRATSGRSSAPPSCPPSMAPPPRPHGTSTCWPAARPTDPCACGPPMRRPAATPTAPTPLCRPARCSKARERRERGAWACMCAFRRVCKLGSNLKFVCRPTRCSKQRAQGRGVQVCTRVAFVLGFLSSTLGNGRIQTTSPNSWCIDPHHVTTQRIITRCPPGAPVP